MYIPDEELTFSHSWSADLEVCLLFKHAVYLMNCCLAKTVRRRSKYMMQKWCRWRNIFPLTKVHQVCGNCKRELTNYSAVNWGAEFHPALTIIANLTNQGRNSCSHFSSVIEEHLTDRIVFLHCLCSAFWNWNACRHSVSGNTLQFFLFLWYPALSHTGISFFLEWMQVVKACALGFTVHTKDCEHPPWWCYLCGLPSQDRMQGLHLYRSALIGWPWEL